MTRRYGWRPSYADHRDLLANTTGLPILAEVDPRSKMQPVDDQGDLGSCTANAVQAAFRYDHILDGKPPKGNYSRLDLYYGERQLEGTLDQGDCGAVGRDAFKYLQHTGICTEKVWPYDISTFQTPPADAMMASTAKLTKPYKAVTKVIGDMRRVLSNNQSIAIGFSVYESFESDIVAETGIMPYPSKGEKLLGGHETLIVGYLEKYADYALVRNSWGADWGLGGYFLMPWHFILSPLASDLRTIVRS